MHDEHIFFHHLLLPPKQGGQEWERTYRSCGYSRRGKNHLDPPSAMQAKGFQKGYGIPSHEPNQGVYFHNCYQD